MYNYYYAFELRFTGMFRHLGRVTRHICDPFVILVINVKIAAHVGKTEMIYVEPAMCLPKKCPDVHVKISHDLNTKRCALLDCSKTAG